MTMRLYRAINDEFGLIYYTTPKAACTSIRRTLKVRGPANDGGRDLDKISHYLSFTTVRNPWDRVVSLYSDFVHSRDAGTRKIKLDRLCYSLGIGLGISWPNFVAAIGRSPEEDNMHYRSQYLLHPPKPVDQLIKFENLKSGWDQLRRLRPGLPKLKHRNHTRHDPFETYYTIGQAKVIGQRYRVDIKRYGYVSPCSN